MKNLIKKNIYIFIFLLSSIVTSAQHGAIYDSLLAKALSSNELLPMLIDSAIKNSPDIKRAHSFIEVAEANLQANKREIYNSFNLSSSYGYGTLIAAANDNYGAGAMNKFSTLERSTYNVGVGVVLPLTQILNRKNIIRSGKQQVNIASAEKENTALSIKQEVIKLYQALKLTHKLIYVNSKSMHTAQVSREMAEKNFLQGQMTLEQFSIISETYHQAVQDFETSVNAFQTNHMMLEAYTGVNLSNLIGQIK